MPQFWFQIDYWPHCLGYLSELRRTEYNNRKLKLQNQQSESGYDLNEGDIQINHEDFFNYRNFWERKMFWWNLKTRHLELAVLNCSFHLWWQTVPAKIYPELLFQLQIIQHPCLLFLTFKRSARKKIPSVSYKWDWMDWIGRAFGWGEVWSSSHCK